MENYGTNEQILEIYIYNNFVLHETHAWAWEYFNEKQSSVTLLRWNTGCFEIERKREGEKIEEYTTAADKMKNQFEAININYIAKFAYSETSFQITLNATTPNLNRKSTTLFAKQTT